MTYLRFEMEFGKNYSSTLEINQVILTNIQTWLQIRILSLSAPRASWGQRQADKIVLGLTILGDLFFQSK